MRQTLYNPKIHINQYTDNDNDDDADEFRNEPCKFQVVM